MESARGEVGGLGTVRQVHIYLKINRTYYECVCCVYEYVCVCVCVCVCTNITESVIY